MKGVFSGILIVLLVSTVFVASYLVYDNWPRDSVPLVPMHRTSSNTSVPPITSQVNSSARSLQFYPNMRFPSDQISYGFSSECTQEKEDSVRGAFAILEEKTRLRFSPSSSPQIMITCSELAPEPAIKDHFVAGEGGPTEIINGSVYALILAGKISLYREERCDSPHIALHEVLHVLGFDHNTNPRSILYPTLDCAQTLDTYFVDDLNRLYATPTQPDLVIIEATGNTSGKYLSFETLLENQGLANVDEVTLRVRADGRVVKDFSIGNLTMGTKKLLTVSNLNVGRGAREVILEIDPLNAITELHEDNNDLSLSLQAT